MRIGIVSPFNPYEFKDYLNCDDIPSINQSARSIHVLVRGLLEMGHNVTVYTTFPYSHEKNNKRYDGTNLCVYVISRHYLVPKVGAIVRLFLHKRIAKTIRLKINDLDIIHAHWTYEYAMAASMFVDVLPVYCTVRDWCPVIMKNQKGITNKIYWFCSYFVFKRVISNEKIKFIANSSYTLKKIQSYYPNRTVRLIFNPIDKNDIIVERHYYPDRPVFISISGGMESYKNIISLVNAFQKYRIHRPESILLLVGGDFSKDNPIMINWFERGLLNNVELKGRKSHKEILELLDCCSAMIHPSLEETFGNVLLEAMSRKVPVVGGIASGAVPEVLDYGDCGILCNVLDIDDICQSMKDVLTPSKREILTKNATQKLMDLYSSDIIAEQHICCYSGH